MFLPCRPCCGGGCPADGKSVTDPAVEGTWSPSGNWKTGVSWTFSATPSSTPTWFFYGSAATSKRGGGASVDEQQDWGNICNWYSHKTTSPSNPASITSVLIRRASTLPTASAIVHVYSPVSTAAFGAASIRSAYFWDSAFYGGSLSCSSAAHGTIRNSVFYYSNNKGSISGGALFFGQSTAEYGSLVTGGATFIGEYGGGAAFYYARNYGSVSNGALFDDLSANEASGTVSGGADFDTPALYLSDNYGTVSGGATFSGTSFNRAGGVVNDGAVFNDDSHNQSSVTIAATINGGAVFNDSSVNFGVVNGGAEFNDTSGHRYISDTLSVVYGGATFNNAACSTQTSGSYAQCPSGAARLRFVAHPTDLPTCNGTAPTACSNYPGTPPSCGCG